MLAVSNVPRYGDYYVFARPKVSKVVQWLGHLMGYHLAWSTVARFRDLILISMAPCPGKDGDAHVMLALIHGPMYGVEINVLPA